MVRECVHPTCGSKCRRPKKKLIRKPIRKISKKRARTFKDKKTVRDTDHVLYLEIWEERPHIDFETGELIMDGFSTLLFHHVLPKGVNKYKKYRHSKWNIVLLSKQTHTQVESDINLCPKIKEYQNYLIKKYINNEKVSTHLQ